MVTYPPDDVDDEVPVVDMEPDSSRGQATLVVGDARDAAAAVASRRLFTDGDRERLQLLVSTRSRTWDGAGRPALETLHYRPEPATTGAACRTDCSDVVDGRLTTLGLTISQRILEFRRPVDDEIDLRLCVDALTDLLAAHDREVVFRFVNMIAGQLRTVGGSGQFHLPTAWDSDEALRLAPLFDGVIEVGAVGDRYRYRWLLGTESGEWRVL